MSLYSSLRTSASGLYVNSQRIATISDNIANLNTVGYKRAEADFSTFLTTNTVGYTPGGIQSTVTRDIDQQGSIEISDNSTDFSISGKGYFIVTDRLAYDEESDVYRPTGSTYYTRSGQFRADSDGNLRNSNGYYLLSWNRNEEDTEFLKATEASNFISINVANKDSDPNATTELDIGVNLTTDTLTGSANAFHVRQSVIDGQGTPRNLELIFERVSPLGPEKTIFFTDGNNVLDIDYNLSQPDHWRAYAVLDDAQIVTYNSDGTPNVGTDTAVPIADVIFDSAGNLDTMLPPGLITEYMQTKYPSQFNLPNTVSVTELGIATTNPIDLRSITSGGARTDAEMRAMGEVLDRYTTGLTFSDPPTTAEIVTGLQMLDTGANPDAMLEFYRSISGVIAVSNVSRSIANIPSATEGSIADYTNYNSRFGAPLFGETSNHFSGGRFVDVEGNVQFDDVGLVKYIDDGTEKLRITVDYNNDIGSEADQVDIDLNLGSLNFKALQPGGVLNESNDDIEVTNAGTGGDGLTNFYDKTSTVRFLQHDGRQFASLEDVNINSNGVINGNFSNGDLRDLYQVPLALFANPNGMITRSGNAYSFSEESGPPRITEANTRTAGGLRGFSLEASSVDVAQEFSDMIVTQRGYSATTKVISAADEMLRELTSLR
ncbi:MAG: flagellar hook-basal body complex protein [Alphaproteobacteria bacterium]|nr:flagellar hook-basal body complex protein [Alphaproteobacteria bacterium]